MAAAVLLATSKDAFSEILSISGLFHDVPIILVLPDREAETVAKGHTLYPRFMAYIDGDLTDVAAVLGKMLGSYNSRNKDLADLSDACGCLCQRPWSRNDR